MWLRRTLLLISLTTVMGCNQQPIPNTTPTLEIIVTNAATTALAGRGRLLEARVVSSDPSSAVVHLRLEGREALRSEVNDAVAQALFGRVALLEFDTRVSSVGLQAETVCPGSAIYNAFTARAKPNALSSARVALNPGHGWTRGDAGAWALQRGFVNTAAVPSVYVQEDDNNLEQAIEVSAALTSTGATVNSARNLDKSAGNGVSGNPKWQEAAKHHLEALGGVPAGVWDSERGAKDQGCQIDKDVRSRPLYANYLNADALIGLHSNAFADSSARGTRIYYSTENVFGSTPPSQITESRALAVALGAALVTAIRADRPDLNWPDAQVIGDAVHGETRFAQMPAVIIETGFHTNPIDGPALSQPSFRATVARGIKQGLSDYLAGGTVTPPAGPVYPQAPLLSSPSGAVRVAIGGSLELRWTPVQGAARQGLYISKAPYGPTNLVYSFEQVSASASSLSIPLSAFVVAGISDYRWNMTAFDSSGGNGAFAPALNFTLTVFPVPVIPAVPTGLGLRMSSLGRVLLSWNEVSDATQYEFAGSFNASPLTITDRAPARGAGMSGAVAVFTDFPEAAEKDGKSLCLSIKAMNANGSSNVSSEVCTTYRFYSAAAMRLEPVSTQPVIRMQR